MLALPSAQSLRELPSGTLEEWRKIPAFMWMNNLYSDTVKVFPALYDFADKYEIRGLRNDIMSAFCLLHYLLGSWSFDIVPLAYAGSLESSPFCQYLAKTIARHWGQDRDNERSLPDLDDLPRAFLWQIMAINSRRANGNSNAEEIPGLRPDEDDEIFLLGSLCTFHEHDSSSESEKCKAEGLVGNPFVCNLLASCLEVARLKLALLGEDEADEPLATDEVPDLPPSFLFAGARAQ